MIYCNCRIDPRGRLAQLGERCVRNAEVGGSIPPSSTNINKIKYLRRHRGGPLAANAPVIAAQRPRRYRESAASGRCRARRIRLGRRKREFVRGRSVHVSSPRSQPPRYTSIRTMALVIPFCESALTPSGRCCDTTVGTTLRLSPAAASSAFSYKCAPRGHSRPRTMNFEDLEPLAERPGGRPSSELRTRIKPRAQLSVG